MHKNPILLLTHSRVPASCRILLCSPGQPWTHAISCLRFLTVDSVDMATTPTSFALLDRPYSLDVCFLSSKTKKLHSHSLSLEFVE